MKRVLITGGCGFIGSNLIEFLIQKTNWEINILDNLSSGSLEDIKNLDYFEKRVNFYEGDIRNIEDISISISKCNFVINLAAQTNVLNSVRNPREDESVNIRGLLNLLVSSQKEPISKFLQASSAAALGHTKMPINEKRIPKPISPYGVSKLAGEAYCRAFSESSKLNSIVLRFSNVYGPKSYHKGSVIPKFIKRIIQGKFLEIYGDGYQTRDFIYVKDICRAIYLSLIKTRSSFNLFQLGTGIKTSINQLVDQLEKLSSFYGLKFPEIKYKKRREGEIYQNFTNISKVKRELGFSKNYDLNEGLKKTFKWFLGLEKNSNLFDNSDK